jgi:hypothetical protein
MSLVCRCGATLLEDISSEGVTPVGGQPIAFRRTTDFVVCDVCHSVYRVSQLQEGRQLDESVLGTQEAGESLVETLERLLDDGV